MSTSMYLERMLLYPQENEPRYFVRHSYGVGWLNGYAAAYHEAVWDRAEYRAIALCNSREDAERIAHALNAAEGLPDRLPDEAAR